MDWSISLQDLRSSTKQQWWMWRRNSNLGVTGSLGLYKGLEDTAMVLPRQAYHSSVEKRWVEGGEPGKASCTSSLGMKCGQDGGREMLRAS